MSVKNFLDATEIVWLPTLHDGVPVKYITRIQMTSLDTQTTPVFLLFRSDFAYFTLMLLMQMTSSFLMPPRGSMELRNIGC